MKVSRNEPCSCGSNKKYKHCCENKTGNDRSKLSLLALSAILVLSIGYFGYLYLDEIYSDILKLDFRKKIYEYEYYKCNNPSCTKDHQRKQFIGIEGEE